ncbi:MAG: 1,4-dihydroxy-2-naphthoate polyprenyltransferase [Candidatus Sericytochromatia bacterium]|nr:1,4-dihydroxy-2-naphthoate polyprenyltransferase [Candidatus Sericytochromatia bacterium]
MTRVESTPGLLKRWILAARPRTLGAALAPVWVGSALALTQGQAHPGVFVAALLGALLIQVGTNFANDYFDFVKGADTETRIGPTRATQAGWMTPQQVRKAFILTFGLVALPGAYLAWMGGIPILILGILSVLSGILYTGGPFPLGYKGLGDLFVLLFFGFGATLGTYWLHTHSISQAAVLASLAPGLLATAILVVNNLRDHKTDALAGKRTLAVRFGVKFVRFEYLFCLILGTLAPLWVYLLTPVKHPASLLACGVLFASRKPLQAVFTLDADPRLNPVLGQTNRLLLIHSLLFSAGLMT